jgi:membrane-bound lytic murein transglycosylase B
VLDALATLAFDFPASHPRAAERTPTSAASWSSSSPSTAPGARPAAPRGSYAGAMGMPQFMPSSWARWGWTTTATRRIDLCAQPDDVIGSVASYFKGYGWNTGMPTHYPVRFDRNAGQGSAAGARHPADLQRAQLPGQGRGAGRHRRWSTRARWR